MTSVLAIPPLLALFKQLVEDGLNGGAVRCVRFVEGQHVDEDEVPLVEEEVAEEVEGVGFADSEGVSTIPLCRE